MADEAEQILRDAYGEAPRQLGPEDFIDGQLERRALKYPTSGWPRGGGPSMARERNLHHIGLRPEEMDMPFSEFLAGRMKQFAHESARGMIPAFGAAEDGYQAYQEGRPWGVAGNAALGATELALPFAANKLGKANSYYGPPGNDTWLEWLASLGASAASLGLPNGMKASPSAIWAAKAHHLENKLDNIPKPKGWDEYRELPDPPGYKYRDPAEGRIVDELTQLDPLARPLSTLKVHEQPVDVYHGTKAEPFDRFDKSKASHFGIHAGTPSQANDFASPIYGAPRVLPMKIGPQDRPFTSLEVNDLGGWSPYSMMRELEKRGVRFSAEEAKPIIEGSADGRKIIESVLDRHGIAVFRSLQTSRNQPSLAWLNRPKAEPCIPAGIRSGICLQVADQVRARHEERCPHNGVDGYPSDALTHGGLPLPAPRLLLLLNGRCRNLAHDLAEGASIFIGAKLARLLNEALVLCLAVRDGGLGFCHRGASRWPGSVGDLRLRAISLLGGVVSVLVVAHPLKVYGVELVVGSLSRTPEATAVVPMAEVRVAERPAKSVVVFDATPHVEKGGVAFERIPFGLSERIPGGLVHVGSRRNDVAPVIGSEREVGSAPIRIHFGANAPTHIARGQVANVFDPDMHVRMCSGFERHDAVRFDRQESSLSESEGLLGSLRGVTRTFCGQPSEEDREAKTYQAAHTDPHLQPCNVGGLLGALCRAPLLAKLVIPLLGFLAGFFLIGRGAFIGRPEFVALGAVDILAVMVIGLSLTACQPVSENHAGHDCNGNGHTNRNVLKRIHEQSQSTLPVVGNLPIHGEVRHG